MALKHRTGYENYMFISNKAAILESLRECPEENQPEVFSMKN